MKTFEVAKTAAVYVYGDPVSMANGFRGLGLIVAKKLKKPADNGDVFVFINRAKDYLKALFFDNDGWCIFAKKLPKGTFDVEGIEGEITINQMLAIVNGVVLPHRNSAPIVVKAIKKAA